MKLTKLSFLNFKNLAGGDIAFPARLSCLVGANGAGKTNVLEAIHYLSMCKGAMGLSDPQSVRHGEDFFIVEGAYESDEGKHEQVACSYRRQGGKSVRRGEKEYERLSEHIGLVPLVVVFPSDVFLVSEAAEERRRYLNSFISQVDRAYLDALVRYNNVLQQRNRLLKDYRGDVACTLDILDMQMVQHGQKIFERRAAMIADLAPLVARYYAALSDDSEQVELSYRSELNEMDFADLLTASRERDRVNRFSTSGPHRDDMVMQIGGYPLRKYGSQGQQKSFLVALKLAQYQLVRQHSGEKPILLLDDLFDKLDVARVERLIGLVAGDDFGQIFITDCNKLRLEGILERSGEPYSLFEVDEGKIEQKI